MNEIYYIEATDADSFTPEGLKAFMDRYGACGKFAVKDGTGCMMVYGAIGNGFWEWCDTDYNSITARVSRFEEDPEVERILIVINSPGGQVQGLETAARRIRACVKPTTALITGEACSAAYALAAACGKVVMEHDALTGSCGCYCEATGRDPEWERKERGLVSRIFRSRNAPRKNVSPVTDEEAAKAVQERVDRWGDSDLSMVAEFRGVPLEKAQETFGQGAVVDADHALANGMVDEIGTIGSIFAPSREEVKEDNGMDISALTAEERTEAFLALIAADPALLSETRKAERERVAALNSRRTGSAEADALIDSALEDGRDAKDIALQLVDIANRERKAALEGLVSGTTTVAGIPQDTPRSRWDEAADRLNAARR